MILGLVTPQPLNPRAQSGLRLKESCKSIYRNAKKGDCLPKLGAFLISRLAPNFTPSLSYFLNQSIGFTNTEFALKAVTGDFFGFIGVLSAQKMISSKKKHRGLGTFFLISSLLDAYLVMIVRHPWGHFIDPIHLILIYACSRHLLYEFKHFFILKLVLSVAPPGCETFTLSLFNLAAQLSTSLGITLGLRLVSFFEIENGSFENLPLLIGFHALFHLVAGAVSFSHSATTFTDSRLSSTYYRPLPLFLDQTASLFASRD